MKQKKRPWTQNEISVLHAAYPDTPTAALAASLGRTDRQVYGKAKALGLKKSAAYLAGPHACRLRRGDNVGTENRFKKGMVPWNKGVKGLNLAPATQFKPGNRSGKAIALYRPVGTLRINQGYLERKINDDQPIQRRWRAVHILVWEAVHVPLPKGHVVAFLDGRHTTEEVEITLDRLECISRAELMRRNTYHRYPPEIAQAIQLKSALSRQINKRSQRP